MWSLPFRVGIELGLWEQFVATFLNNPELYWTGTVFIIVISLHSDLQIKQEGKNLKLYFFIFFIFGASEHRIFKTLLLSQHNYLIILIIGGRHKNKKRCMLRNPYITTTKNLVICIFAGLPLQKFWVPIGLKILPLLVTYSTLPLHMWKVIKCLQTKSYKFQIPTHIKLKNTIHYVQCESISFNDFFLI
jgi:uncharacterized membrane protein